jgi:hypothetical protein
MWTNTGINNFWHDALFHPLFFFCFFFFFLLLTFVIIQFAQKVLWRVEKKKKKNKSEDENEIQTRLLWKKAILALKTTLLSMIFGFTNLGKLCSSVDNTSCLVLLNGRILQLQWWRSGYCVHVILLLLLDRRSSPCCC